jgi:heme A synthase
VEDFMDTILALHRVLSNTAVLFFLAMGLWGVYRAVRKQGVDASYLGAMIIGEGVFVAQAVLGTIMWIAGDRPGRTIHLLYGVFAIVALPGLFAYLKGDDSNQAQWYYAVATLFLFGVALRAIGTGAG